MVCSLPEGQGLRGVVAGAPVAAGAAVPVLSSVLTVGSAGLYQVTIQLPVNVPTGTVAVQASVDGVQTPSGVTIPVEQ